MAMAESLSRTPIRIIIEGIGEARGELVKILAPLTVGALLKRMPLRGRIHPTQGGHSFIVSIRRGTEKAVSSVEAGTIAYWPMGDAVVLYSRNARPYSPVNKVGQILEGLELLEGLRSGSRVSIDRI
jgi:hypothetical protein